MTATVEAVYEEENILRLLSPLSLEKGQQVEVTIKSVTLAELERNAPNPSRVAEIMAGIVALSVIYDRPETASRDHDLFLYGPEGAW